MTGIWTNEAREDADRRGLAGPVGAQQDRHLARCDRKIQPRKGGPPARIGDDDAL
jgi:hypothetical protein